MTKRHTKIDSKDTAGKYLPKPPGQAVGILVPLWGVRWQYRDEGHPKKFLEYRRHLEDLASYIGFRIRESGVASSYDCKSDNMKLYLILTGENIQDICGAVKKYSQLPRLPEGSTIAIFTDDSTKPQEISIVEGLQPLEELFSREEVTWSP